MRRDRRPVALFGVEDDRILLTANPHGYPHGVEIFIRGSTGASIDALTVDPANAQARWSPDGDALAFRRFVTWLRAGIARSGADRELTFNDEISGERHRATLCELLLYEEPFFGDEFVVDWRCQIDLLAPQRAHTIVAAEVAAWRAFLGAHVHAALARPALPPA
jgi:hypothetical protein